MKYEFDEFVRKQVIYQYEKEMKTDNKRVLNFEPFKELMERMSEERYDEIGDILIEGTLKNVQNAVENEYLTYKDMIIFYLKRIEKLDSGILNTIIELNPDAILLAEKADENRPVEPNILYGIPVLVKDNIATGDNMHNTAGSVAMKENIPKVESPIIKKLKSLGAIVLGKNNMSEWAFYMSTKGICGYSALGGQTHNPYGRFGVGGSSSGSAASIASNFAMLSIGTETSGSITYPAGQNSIVGIYPTKSVWSNKYIIPISESLDTPGPMARTVEDAAVLLWNLTEDFKIKEKNLDFYLKKPFESITIGIIENDGIKENRREGDTEILNKLENEFQSIGFTVKTVYLEDKGFKVDMDKILEYEFNISMRNYLKSIKSTKIKSLEDIVSVYEENPKSYAPYGFDLLINSIETEISDCDNSHLYESNKKSAQSCINGGLEEVDVLLTLSSQFSTVYASAGYPSITFPAGYREDGEPVGVTLTAKAYEEGKLVQIAYSYEKAMKKRKKPML